MIYLIISKNNDNNYHCQFEALGHEIHLGRYILMDMLNGKYIDNNNYIIVTARLERKFLYSKLFDKIISYNDFIKLNQEDKNIIYIWPFLNGVKERISKNYIDDFKKKNNYPIEKVLFTEMNKLEINYLLNKIDYQLIEDDNLIKEKYIIIHHRVIDYNKISNNNISNNNIFTQKIVNYIMNNFNYNIIIFSSDSNIKFNCEDLNRIKYINSLDLYCSFLNNDKCLCLISELSGGGEISQYCHNKLIIHYNNSYNPQPIHKTVKSLQDNTNCLHNNWNYHGCSDAVLIRTNFDNIFDILTKELNK